MTDSRGRRAFKGESRPSISGRTEGGWDVLGLVRTQSLIQERSFPTS